MPDIEQQVIDIIAREAQIDSRSIQPGTTLDALGIPSLTQLDVLFAIEEAFGIELADKPEDLTLGGLTRQIAEALEAKNRADGAP